MAQTDYFSNAYGFIIEDSDFSTVYGDQTIYNNQQIYHDSGERERTEYDDFNEVISGNIYRTKDYGVRQYPRQWDTWKRLKREEGDSRADRTIRTAEVIGVDGRLFTVVAYRGPEAREAFEQDFQKYSKLLTANSFQVYGVNLNVPLVLFHNELQPLWSFEDSLGFWGQRYIVAWGLRMDCSLIEVWMDPSKGALCLGPWGPKPRNDAHFFEVVDVNIPSDIELLQGNIFLRFLASLKSKDVDRTILQAVKINNELSHFGGPVRQACFFSISTNAAVASISTVVWKNLSGFEDGEIMSDGQARFILGRKAASTSCLQLETESDEIELAWLSQASSVFHTYGVSLDSDLRDYVFVRPHLSSKGFLSDCQEARKQRAKQTIYLFIHPEYYTSESTPTENSTSFSYHYWSFEPTGQPPLSTETCDLLGLPVQLSYIAYTFFSTFWNNAVYKQVHEYQIARGFDPTTLDFTRSLGYTIYQVQHESHRFEAVADAATAASSTSPATEITALPAVSQTASASKPVSPSKKHAHRVVSQPTVSSRFPPTAKSLSNNSRTSRSPGGSAATASRAPRTPPATGARSPPQLRKPSVQAPVVSSTRKGVVRGNDAQSGSASRKVVSMPSQAPVVATRRQPPPPSKPIDAKPPPPKPRALQSATMTSALTRKATTCSSTLKSSRPQTKPGPTPQAGVPASHPLSGGGTERIIGNRGTPNVTETSSNGVKQCRTPAISTPTRPTKAHERSSSTPKRAWR